MEILVCFKQVPDDSVEIGMDASTGKPDLKGADPQGNAFDTYALEMAARYTEEHGGTVTACTVGTEDDKVCLKNALAVGAKKAYLVTGTDAETQDADQVASVLAAAIPKMEEANGAKFDLILCGRESTDNIGGQVGELLAQKFPYPFVTNIVAVDPKDDGVTMKKELDEGYQVLELPLPAVATVSKPNYDPRYPTIKNKLAARRMQIPEIAAEPADAKVEYLAFSEPPKRQAGVKIQDDDDEVAVKQAMEILISDKVL